MVIMAVMIRAAGAWGKKKVEVKVGERGVLG